MKKALIISISFIILIISGYKIYFSYLSSRTVQYSTIKINGTEKVDSVEVYKSKRKLTLFSSGKDLKSYNISLGKNPIGAKQFEGDKKTPEGKYILDRKKENSSYYLAMHISYPNEDDKIKAASLNKPAGGDIMLHGIPNKLKFLESYYINTDWTDGCIAVSNDDMDELWKVIDEGTPITIYP
jgi:murein L,D-transpeptidase YafK